MPCVWTNFHKTGKIVPRVRSWPIHLLLAIAILLTAGIVAAADPTAATDPSAGPTVQTFDHDPGWEGFNNRMTPKVVKTVQQSFGYSPTNFAGQQKGEIGGTLWRSETAAYYAKKIEPKTLADKLTASGTFALTASDGSSGVFCGWFKSGQVERGRQNSLGFRLSGQGTGARMGVQLVTSRNQACGTKITPWTVNHNIPEGTPGRKYRPTSIRNDGTRYTWQMTYDPDANGGDGQIQFVIHSNLAKPDQTFEGKTFTVNLPKGYKQQNATFDRFGIRNNARPGNAMTLWFDDLTIDGVAEHFAADPAWEAVGVDAKFAQSLGGVHDFGYSPETHFAGGSMGEIGGTIWRSGEYGYYADRVEKLSLNDPLEASGRIVLLVGPPDSGAYLGWFNGSEKQKSPAQGGNFLGVKIGGPTHAGHYFAPAYATTQPAPPKHTTRKHDPNVSVRSRVGPVLVPRTVYQWKLRYDPSANGGRGTIVATLGGESVTLNLKPGDKAKGATFDRFGLSTMHIGGSYLKVYLDDVSCTSRPASPDPR